MQRCVGTAALEVCRLGEACARAGHAVSIGRFAAKSVPAVGVLDGKACIYPASTEGTAWAFMRPNRVVAQAQGDVESAKRQQAFFQQHLQELTLFKAKTSAALLQACDCVAGTWHSAWSAS
jgi:hypothetical protein